MLQNGDPVNTLITDLQMPGLHGFELARRAKELRPAMVIIYCTGRPEMIGDDMGPPLGPIITKPCTAERLHQEIERLRA